MYKILFFSPEFHIIKHAFDSINVNMSIKYNTEGTEEIRHPSQRDCKVVN